MAIARYFCSLIFNLFFINILSRDPFNLQKKVKVQEFSLNAIVENGDKIMASLRYGDKCFCVKKNSKINNIYRVVDITPNDVTLLDLENNREKVILLHN